MGPATRPVFNRDECQPGTAAAAAADFARRRGQLHSPTLAVDLLSTHGRPTAYRTVPPLPPIYCLRRPFPQRPLGSIHTVEVVRTNDRTPDGGACKTTTSARQIMTRRITAR